ncbi:MAG: membrane protein insertion efficiency factor YidD, partial [Rubrobacter sp.]|nr:membrane protein insertion efficiency factor YidD [Rubrobacter sp.]
MIGILSSGAVRAITLYQRRVSPYKGFSCPHRLLHGGLSCSGYAKYCIRASGARAALPTIRDHLSRCRDARIFLQASHVCDAHGGQHDSAWRRWRRRISRTFDACDCADCGCDIID